LLKLNIKLLNISQLRKNVLSGAVLSGFSIVLFLISYPIYIKIIGIDLFGLWVSLSIVITVSQLGLLGINSALIKFSAEAYGKQSVVRISEYLVSSLAAVVTPIIILYLFLLLFRNQIVTLLNLPNEYEIIALEVLPFIGAISIIIVVNELYKGVLMGVGKVDWANYIFLVGRVLQFIVTVILLLLGSGIWGLLIGALVLYLFSMIIAMIVLKIKFNVQLGALHMLNLASIIKLYKFGGPLFIGQVISMLIIPFNKVIITRYLGLNFVTYYDIATRSVLQVRAVYESGLRAIMPKISEYISYSSQQTVDKIKRIHYSGIKFIGVFALPIFLLLFVFAPLLIEFWLRDEYSPFIPNGFRIMLIGYFVNLICVPAYYIFMGIGKVGICIAHILIQSILNVVLVLSIIFMDFEISLPLLFWINTISLIIASIFILIKYKEKYGK